MVASTTTKLARGADTATFPMGFLDTGAGAIVPITGQTDAAGVLINPASAEGITALDGKLGSAGSSPPSLPGSGSGVIGWLRKLYDTLAGVLTVSTRNGLAITQTVVPIALRSDGAAAGAVSVIAANASRRYLSIINIGLGDVSLGFGVGVAAGAGFPLNGADTLGRQGGSLSWEGTGVPVGAIFATSVAGTTLAVLEG